MARAGGDATAPSNLTAAAMSPTEIRVDWHDNSTNEAAFEIYRSTTGQSGTYAQWATADANTVVYVNESLTEGTQYCYKVRSVVVKGVKTTYSAFTNAACATTPVTPPPPPPPAPAAPSELRPKPLASTEVRLNWTDNTSNEDGFRIDRSTDAGATWAVAGTVPANNSTFAEGGRAAEVQVCYRVVAVNAGGEAVSATACTTPPAAPTNLTGTPVDSTGYDLSWTDNSAVENGYEVWGYFSYPPYCTGEVCEAGYSEGEELLATLPANSTAYRCENCAGASYFRVAASKDGGHSSSDMWQPTQ
ncbi:MAG: hypothetical protein ACSLFE_11895 [Gemmatimonadaceae bacterium]